LHWYRDIHKFLEEPVVGKGIVMKIMSFKVVVLGLFLTIGLTRFGYASEVDGRLQDLRFIDYQLGAVSTDMHLYLGWAFDDKQAMKEASEKAILDLKELEQQVAGQEYPAALKDLKAQMVDLIKGLQQIYAGIEVKDIELIEKEFTPFNDLYSKYGEAFKAAWLNTYPNGELNAELEQSIEEVKCFADETTKKSYQKALDLIKIKKYADAYILLRELEIDAPASAGHMIKLRMSDTLRQMNPEEASKISPDLLDKSTYGLKLLTEIVDSNAYSPVLYEAFYKWRTTTQEMDHGMSNYSSIPNKEYNQKRWQVIRIIKKHQAENPSDKWAGIQVDLLWDLRNIQRGGPMGNDNLIHWGILYGNIDDIKGKNKTGQ